MLITLARKPLVGSVVQNVLAHGTGGINVDGCRVGTDGGTAKGSKPQGEGKGIYGAGLHGVCEITHLDAGRWPANLIHDGSGAVLARFPQTKSGQHSESEATRKANGMFAGGIATEGNWYGDSGSAARFFKQIQGD